MPIIGQLSEEGVERIFDEKTKEIVKRLDTMEDLIIKGNIRLEALVSLAIEKEMITQDSFDAILKLLIDYAKGKD